MTTEVSPPIVPQQPLPVKKGRGKAADSNSFFEQLYISMHGSKMSDNFPLYGSTDYGKGGSPTYYFMAEPTPYQLANTARYTAMGHRIVYGLSEDVWINNFSLEFPGAEIDSLTIKQINNEIYQHNLNIGLYDEGRKGTSFNYEQGEALLMIYREGDGNLKLYENLVNGEPNYLGFDLPADTEKEIRRVEAVNRMDYYIPQIQSFGLPMYYLINFYGEFNKFQSYKIHPSRAIRIRTENIDYDQYYGQSKLKAVFPNLTIIQNVCRSMAVAVHRFAYGLPWVQTKGVRTAQQMAFVKSAIGDPTTQDWFITNQENIADIKMLGFATSQMDMATVIQTQIDLISADSKIPQPILMGKESGVTVGGEVNERSYFANLDAQHSILNKYLRQFIAIDPFYTRIFAKYNIKNYVINWGLRQVMSKEQEASWKMQLYSNLTTMMQFAAFDEVRAEANLPSWTAYYNDDKHPYRKKLCEKCYGISPEELDSIVPNLGMWRQRVLQEIIQTPVEQEQAKINQELLSKNNSNAMEAQGTKPNTQGQGLASANKPASVASAGGTLSPDEKQLARVASKMEREHGDIDSLHVALGAIAAAQMKTDMATQIIKETADFKKSIIDDRAASLNKVMEMWGMNKNDTLALYDRIQKVMNNDGVRKRIKELEEERKK